VRWAAGRRQRAIRAAGRAGSVLLVAGAVLSPVAAASAERAAPRPVPVPGISPGVGVDDLLAGLPGAPTLPPPPPPPVQVGPGVGPGHPGNTSAAGHGAGQGPAVATGGSAPGVAMPTERPSPSSHPTPDPPLPSVPAHPAHPVPPAELPEATPPHPAPSATPARKPAPTARPPVPDAGPLHHPAAGRPYPPDPADGPQGSGTGPVVHHRRGHGEQGPSLIPLADGGTPPALPPAAAEPVGRPASERQAASSYEPVRRVLPLGAGLALVGLGLGFLGLRLRRA
jgi:hypothetical protein